MGQSQPDKEFRDALQKWETSLETPVLPGELELWADNVWKAADEFNPLLTRQQTQLHRDLFDKIVTEDEALLRRVENLRREDKAIREAFDTFQSAAKNLHDRAAQIEPDEQEASETIRKVKDAGLPLVIRIREQELAVTTWLTEAMERDRGVQD